MLLGSARCWCPAQVLSVAADGSTFGGEVLQIDYPDERRDLRFCGQVDRRKIFAAAFLIQQAFPGYAIEDVHRVGVMPAHPTQCIPGDTEGAEARHDGTSIDVA